MLLCGLDDVEPGSVLGASVLHPGSPDVELLKPGVLLDAALLARLREMGIKTLWVEADAAADLESLVGQDVTRSKVAVLVAMRDDLSTLGRESLAVGQYQRYRRAVTDLVCQVMGPGRYAGFADAMFAVECGLMSHSVNVAHLAIMAGMDLETYIVAEAKWLPPREAWDLVTLGIAGLLHDVGKARLGARASERGEVGGAGLSDESGGDAYFDHPRLGYDMLRTGRVSARVCQAVLHHHQRFDGLGWSDLLSSRDPEHEDGRQAGDEMHVFTRIVAAANVLENLRREAARSGEPPVAALARYAGSEFDGWFDPMVRRAMLRRLSPFPVGSDVRLSDGRRAVVTAPSLLDPCRPVVRPLDQGSAAVIDLRAEQGLRITHHLGVDVTRWSYEVGPLGPSIARGDDTPAQAA